MRKVANVLFFIFFGIVVTQDLIEAVVFFVLLFLLVLIAIVTTQHVQRYLIDRRFKKDCEELFTEDFYRRLNNVIKNEQLK